VFHSKVHLLNSINQALFDLFPQLVGVLLLLLQLPLLG